MVWLLFWFTPFCRPSAERVWCAQLISACGKTLGRKSGLSVAASSLVGNVFCFDARGMDYDCLQQKVQKMEVKLWNVNARGETETAVVRVSCHRHTLVRHTWWETQVSWGGTHQYRWVPPPEQYPDWERGSSLFSAIFRVEPTLHTTAVVGKERLVCRDPTLTRFSVSSQALPLEIGVPSCHHPIWQTWSHITNRKEILAKQYHKVFFIGGLYVIAAFKMQPSLVQVLFTSKYLF